MSKDEKHFPPNEPMRYSKPKTLLVLAGCALWLAVLGWIDRVIPGNPSPPHEGEVGASVTP